MKKVSCLHFLIMYRLSNLYFSVNIILQRNTVTLKQQFSQFVMKIRKYLTENSASTDFEQFKHFLEMHYKEIPDLNLEDIEGVFQFFINNGYWDYLNFDFLSEAISTFTDAALKRAEREYQDRVSAYMATVKIAEFISENNKLNQHLASKQTPSTARKRSESQYLEILSIKLNVNIGSRTLNYIEDLWKKLSFLNLPKIGVVLDCIVETFVAQGQPLPFDSIEEEPEEQLYEDQQLKAQRRKVQYEVCCSGSYACDPLRLCQRSYWELVAVRCLTSLRSEATLNRRSVTSVSEKMMRYTYNLHNTC